MSENRVVRGAFGGEGEGMTDGKCMRRFIKH
jgi:hypothetical protein